MVEYTESSLECCPGLGRGLEVRSGVGGGDMTTNIFNMTTPLTTKVSGYFSVVVLAGKQYSQETTFHWTRDTVDVGKIGHNEVLID